MSESNSDSNRVYILPVIALLGMFGILLFGINLWYQIDESIDFSILHKQIMTNQTFVDEMDCNKVILTRNVLNQVNSPTQQDEVIILRVHFDQIAIDKKCEVDDEVKK